MTRPLQVSLANRLVGVIDLLGGRAVHAIAGNRKSYRDVAFCAGDPLLLAKHYLTLGIPKLYLADLQSISGGAIQLRVLRSLLQLRFDQFLIDLGWTGDEAADQRKQVTELAFAYPTAHWIAATESCRSTDALHRLAECVPPCGALLGLDFRQHGFLGQGETEAAWIEAAVTARCSGAVVLDVAAVGTGAGPVTLETCRRVAVSAPALTLFSGGGIRGQRDAQLLLEAGCDGVLAATALFPRPCELTRDPLSADSEHDSFFKSLD